MVRFSPSFYLMKTIICIRWRHFWTCGQIFFSKAISAS